MLTVGSLLLTWGSPKASHIKANHPHFSRGASGGCLHGGASFEVEKAHFTARKMCPENRKNEVELRPLCAAPEALHEFSAFLSFRVLIFCLFALWNLHKALCFWGEKDLLHFPHFPVIGFESLISIIRPTGFIMTGLR